MRARDLLNDARDTIVDRGLVYGEPTFNHLRIAQLWSAYLDHGIEPHEVAICMALVKIARIQESSQHEDSYLDACSYLAIAGQIATTDWDDLDAY